VGMAQMMMEEWLRHRAVLPQILAQVPPEKVGFQPWEGAMSLGKLTVHTVASTHFFVSAVASGEFTSQTPPEVSSMEELLQVVADYTAKSKSVYESLSDAQLPEMLEAKFMHLTLPKQAFLASMRDHEVHHKGQLFVYARMAGAKEMPFFVSRG